MTEHCDVMNEVFYGFGHYLQENVRYAMRTSLHIITYSAV
jgi:hypothetical protein